MPLHEVADESGLSCFGEDKQFRDENLLAS
jgi:hypothetical protein